VHEPDPLLTVDDERGWPSDVKGRKPKPMMDAIALDHRTIRIDQDRKRQTVAAAVFRHFVGTLADNHQDLGS
jgi:hypothetical protein